MLSVYTARGMTGRVKSDVVLEATRDNQFLSACGFKVLCPVTKEGVTATKELLLSSEKDMKDSFWPADKRMIRECHVLFHMSPHLNSAGAWQEVGYKRYHLQGPVVHVYPLGMLPPPGAIPRLENDYVCDSMAEAVEYTLRVHGTFWKRTKWRGKKLNRCVLKSIWYQLKEWGK